MAAEAAQEPNQEFLDACMPSPSSAREAARRRVPPLSDDDIGWFHCEACDEPGCCTTAAACPAVRARALRRLRRRPRRGPRRGRGECPCAALSIPAGSSTATPSCTGGLQDLLYIGDFDAWCVALCELAVGGRRLRALPQPDCGERLDTGAGSGARCPGRPASAAPRVLPAVRAAVGRTPP